MKAQEANGWLLATYGYLMNCLNPKMKIADYWLPDVI